MSLKEKELAGILGAKLGWSFLGGSKIEGKEASTLKRGGIVKREFGNRMQVLRGQNSLRCQRVFVSDTGGRAYWTKVTSND